jgi:hypothetical protein
MMAQTYEIRANETSSFTDVADDAWYREYVDTAYRKGFINGYGDGTFGPNDTITYAQFATIVLNMLGYKTTELEGTWPENVERIATYLGIYDNVGYYYNNMSVYREDVAQMIYNALDCKMVYWRNDNMMFTGKTLGEYLGMVSDNNDFNTVIGTVEKVYYRYHNSEYFVVVFEEYDEEFYVSSEDYNKNFIHVGDSMTFTYYFDRATYKYYIVEIATRNENTRLYRDMEVAHVLPGGGNLCRVTFENGMMFNINGSRDNIGFTAGDIITFYATVDNYNVIDEIGVITKVINVVHVEEEETEETRPLDPGFGVDPEVFYTAEGWTRFHTADCHYVTEAEAGIVIQFDPAVHTEQTACKICLADLYE